MSDFFTKPNFLLELGISFCLVVSCLKQFGTGSSFILEQVAVFLYSCLNSSLFGDLGIEALDKALELKKDDAQIHKWYAVLVGSRSEYVSLQERIDDGHKFKKHVDAAIALSPDDASLHYMLGRFDFEVAGLKWYERKVAAALFSEPPNATYTDALQHFIQAEKLANFEWKENKLMIAKCKIATGDYKEAMDWLTQASNCKQGDGLDDKIDSEVKVLMEKYNSYR
ncbi:unnamed protein product [Callosobruchus maculatus]|uniref:Regulator of microtubule dynamics protein 1 n=1 Tax=Callosobruchus maculatus TaxID=64391 RepID=A0A653D979_CALMS|nr:unnamed protein product [Callosobruchus maculatus]